MRLLILVILFLVQPSAFWGLSVPAIRWRVADSLEKVKAADPFPAVLIKNATLTAARNEFEPFQLILRTDEKEVADLDIQISDLHGTQGVIAARKNIAIYLEEFLDIDKPSMLGGPAGLWPDPLIPRIDRFTQERRNAFPFSLHRGRNQPLWIEVYVPESARPGNYTGLATLTHANKPAFSIPISLTVRSFALPSTSTLKSSFGLNGTAILKQHRGKYTSDDDLYALTRLYTKDALWHRISIHGGSMVPPKVDADGHMSINWQSYDAEVGPFLNGTAIGEGEPLAGAKATSVELREPVSFTRDDQREHFWKASVQHFQKMGWYDRLFLYLWDEPAPSDYSKVLDRGRAALEGHPGIRSLVTAPYNTKLEDVVQIWTPLVNCLERKPGSSDFCAEAPPLDAYTREIQRGKSLWFYQSCASHGCNGSGGPYFAGWPSYMIDAPGTANRVMQWVAWKYNVEGELYFSMNESYSHGGDPWTDINLFGGNGDGSLYYPGRPERIGGMGDIPIESIRLKLIREGMEDYEYLALIAKLGGRKAADEFADRIVTTAYQWESQPAAFLKVRQEMGEALDRLTAAHPRNRSSDQ
jgi:Domain of unknown function (DUF4091)